MQKKPLGKRIQSFGSALSNMAGNDDVQRGLLMMYGEPAAAARVQQDNQELDLREKQLQATQELRLAQQALIAERMRPRDEAKLRTAKYLFPNDRKAQQEYLRRGDANSPASVREFEFFRGLTPEQQKQFMSLQRGGTVRDIGGVPTMVTEGPGGAGLQPLGNLEGEAAAGSALEQARAEGRERGKQTEAARLNVGQDVANIENFENAVNLLLSSPGFSSAYGLDGALPTIPGSDKANARALLGQLDAKSFETTIQSMRGLGQLSDAEGKKVSAAFTRATNTSISDEEARKAWQEVLGVLADKKVRAMQKAGVGTAPNTPSGLPDGVTEDDIEFTMKKHGLSRAEVLERIAP